MAEELNNFISVHERRYLFVTCTRDKVQWIRGGNVGAVSCNRRRCSCKLNNMKENKSPGVEISSKILKETVEQISTPLAHVFNMLCMKELYP